MEERRLHLLVFSILGMALIGLAWWLQQTKPPNVFFIVMDTLRADRTTLCGYDRPTTPTLKKLASKGAAYSCKAVTPGSWTLPAHASFFTGLEAHEHQAHSITSGVKSFEGVSHQSRILKRAHPTLAEHFANAGYQTLAVSGNPVVNGSMGLTRGFQSIQLAQNFGDFHGEALIPALHTALAEKNKKKPLFLFINIADAHMPWPAIEEGRDWLKPTPAIGYEKANHNNIWRQIVEGKLETDQTQNHLKQINDLYDQAVSRADENLSATLKYLNDMGWRQPGDRIVITSDHGEFLGEMNLLDHGHYVHDANVTVPLMAIGSVQKLPNRINAAHVFDLVKEGVLPQKLKPVRTAAWPHVRRCARTKGIAFCKTWAAEWNDGIKTIWSDNQFGESDSMLPTSPSESFKDYVEKISADSVNKNAKPISSDVIKMLQKAGYID